MVDKLVRCPVWDFDDISECARLEIFEFKIPLFILSASLLVIISKTVINFYSKPHSKKSETQALLNGSQSQQYTSLSTASEAELVKKSHFDTASLPPTKLNGEPHGEIKYVKRSLSEKLRVVLELLLTFLQLTVQSSKLYALNKFSSPDVWVNLGLWSWLALLTMIRISNLNETNTRLLEIFPNLWVNDFVVYLFLWFSKILVVRSALIGDTPSKGYYVTDFIIITLLLFNLATSSIGYRLPHIYVTDKATKPAPEPYTSLLSFITFSWINPFIWQSYLNVIKISDVWDLKLEDYSYFVLKDFKAYGIRRSSWKFSSRVIMFFSNYLLLQGFWAITESCIVFAPTILLKKILEYVDDRSTSSKNLVWFYVFMMFGSKLLSVVASGQALFLGRRVSVRLRSIIIGEVYAKALRRKLSAQDKNEGEEEDQGKNDQKENNSEEGEKTSKNLGAIINLMAVDAFKISEVCAYLHAFIGAVSMIIVSITLLWKLLGWSALVGAFSIICLSPLNFKLAKLMGYYQKKMLEVTDRRIQKLNETFQSIRIIKFFAWENKFKDQILSIRREELAFLKKRSIAWTFSALLWFITPTIVTLISFSCYIFISKQKLTTPVAFTALSLFDLLRTPLDQLSDMLSFAIQSKVSLDRVQDFLEEEETTKYEQLTKVKNNGKLGFKNASFSWNTKSENDFKLRDLNVEFISRKLNVVIGPTGAGKTSMLLALLGEMELLKGDVFLPGFHAREDLKVDSEGFTESVAYCSQAAWLLNDTIRNNIIFASPFNRDRYNKVVTACGLSRDFEILKAGDQTEIGEKGIALSGGQKQRVSLARALYSNSRHILLDDCLSAVDSHTALHIYENCISGPLMANRTVVLVSHNVALTIREADYVVVMDNGRVSAQGSPEELFHSGHLGDDEMIKSSVGSRQVSSSNLKKIGEEVSSTPRRESKLSEANLVDEEAEELENLKKGKLIEEETKSDGVVSADVYKWFVELFGGYPIIFFILFIFVVTQILQVGQSWWVRKWASVIDNEPVSIMGSLTDFHSNGLITGFFQSSILKYRHTRAAVEVMRVENPSVFYITVYTLFGLGYGIISSARILFVFYAGIRASSRIFKRTVAKVLRAKLRFFDSTPIGRIMNRFSKDIESVDQELVAFADGVIGCLIRIISTLVLISLITPGFLIFAFLIGVIYYVIAFFYLNGSRELKRFDSITKSPIHQHFSETLVGTSTIRAYGIERRFLQENLNKIDENNKPYFYMWVANRWLSIRNDVVGALVVLFAGAFVLLKIDSLDAGLAGISLSYAITFNESALWAVRLYANVEMTMNSVERLKEYLDIDEEPAEFLTENEPPASWPDSGILEFNNLSLRYAPQLPLVIKNVTFTVEPNNKIGIVGRTGAGKSTIITALFRFLDPETGFIKIDGVDITSIGLKALRQAITIIPQDPTLFTGSIKSNLDPFHSYSDEQIFEALKRVNLITGDEILGQAQNLVQEDSDDENQNKFLDLNNEVTEGGGNLSQGQRQLMCLARSLLKAPKIMLLDEATASIDYESDARIQNTIRQEFSESTILTIAHRLRSIIDYDKILVMDAGEVIEFDHPYKLISDPNSIFNSMCQDSGELDVLVQLSKESYVKSLSKK